MKKRTVTFVLPGDEQVYTLVYDFNKLCDIETETGINALRFIGGEVNATQTRAILYGCLKTAHPAVTLEEAGDLLGFDEDTVLGALTIVLKGVEEPPPAPPAPPVVFGAGELPNPNEPPA